VSIIQRMDHFTVLSGDLEKTREFYTMLGLREGERPNFKFPGIWFYNDEGKPILHVIAGRGVPEPPAGVIDHMAFWSKDLAATAEKLKSRRIEYDLRRLPPPYNVWQMFFKDPFGAMVELDFDPNEPAPTGWNG
jgi:catechol 2,3-dioxygenase-like lactoylglutathione lyase family enzyme